MKEYIPASSQLLQLLFLVQKYQEESTKKLPKKTTSGKNVIWKGRLMLNWNKASQKSTKPPQNQQTRNTLSEPD